MSRKHKKILFIITLVVIMLMGCGNSEGDNSADTIDDPAKMPEMVENMPETTQDSNLVTVSYLPETTQETDNGEAVSAGKIGIDFGIESRTDLNGDGKEDRVRVLDVRSGDVEYTQIVANVDGVDVASKDYDGHYTGGELTTGDLSGNGRADVLLKRGVFGSNYGAIEISILHLEDEGWVEYPYNFIPNPDIPLRCPVSFEPDESWMNGDYYVGATLFEKDGMTMVRFIILDYEEYDEDIVRVIEASWQEEGWYIENVEVVDNYYTDDKYVDLEAPFYRIR